MRERVRSKYFNGFYVVLLFVEDATADIDGIITEEGATEEVDEVEIVAVVDGEGEKAGGTTEEEGIREEVPAITKCLLSPCISALAESEDDTCVEEDDVVVEEDKD